MRLLFTISTILFAVFISNAQRQEFLPTIDIGLNGGVSFAQYSDFKGKLKVGGLSLMANTGYNRHILEFDFANSLNDEGLTTPITTNFIKPSTLNLNYTFAREVFAYYPACMIRNQLLLGMRLNAEVFMGNTTATNTIENLYTALDYGRYSADITLITDYYLNENNYLVLQLYTPILSYFAFPEGLSSNNERPYELDDRLDASKSWFFDDGDLGWFSKHSKLGVNATYRLLLSKSIALQLKYNGKIKSISKVNMVGNLPAAEEILENYHQITFGIVGHIIRPPVGF
mgnify:CR=1 FL=1